MVCTRDCTERNAKLGGDHVYEVQAQACCQNVRMLRQFAVRITCIRLTYMLDWLGCTADR